MKARLRAGPSASSGSARNPSSSSNSARRLPRPVSWSVTDSRRRCSVSVRSPTSDRAERAPATTSVVAASPRETRPTWFSEPMNRIVRAPPAASAGSMKPGGSSAVGRGAPVRIHTATDTSRIDSGQAIALNTVPTNDVEFNTLKMSPTVFSA